MTDLESTLRLESYELLKIKKTIGPDVSIDFRKFQVFHLERLF